MSFISKRRRFRLITISHWGIVRLGLESWYHFILVEARRYAHARHTTTLPRIWAKCVYTPNRTYVFSGGAIPVFKQLPSLNLRMWKNRTLLFTWELRYVLLSLLSYSMSTIVISERVHLDLVCLSTAFHCNGIGTARNISENESAASICVCLYTHLAYAKFVIWTIRPDTTFSKWEDKREKVLTSIIQFTVWNKMNTAITKPVCITTTLTVVMVVVAMAVHRWREGMNFIPTLSAPTYQ